MNLRTKLCVPLLLCLSVILFACNDEQKRAGQALEPWAKVLVKTKADYSWPAFLRFWHRGAEEKVFINGAEVVPGGYGYDFGRGVSVFVDMEGDLVRGVRLQYVALEDNNDGGRQFLRVMRHMLRIGTYNWESPEREALFAFYEIMIPQPKELYFKKSYFARYYDAPLKLWTFDFFFVEEGGDMVTMPPLQK